MEKWPCILEIHLVNKQRKDESQMFYRKMDLPFNPFYMQGQQLKLEFDSQGTSYNGYSFEIKKTTWDESKPEMLYVVLHYTLASIEACIQAMKKFLADEKGRYSESFMKINLTSEMLPPNIVALTRTSCHTDIANKPIDGLTINMENGTWNYQRPNDQFKDATFRKIGECNHLMKHCSSGVVGVYNTTDIEQLRAMNKHSCEMTDTDREL